MTARARGGITISEDPNRVMVCSDFLETVAILAAEAAAGQIDGQCQMSFGAVIKLEQKWNESMFFK